MNDPGTSPWREWWREPRATWWALLVLAALLFLHKPHALHTPQLYAEDGSIFLAFNDLHGARAFVEPYMGYLHALPRLVAWSASRLLDPAWWPAFYNGVSFLIWVAAIARTFSSRLALPGKPWLVLAFVVGPQTGEVLFHITNVQWITAILLVQQALITRPTTWGQRTGDGLIVLLAGLTGPFVIALAPLLAWRWWRDRHVDTLAPLLLALACAAVQAWFIVNTAPKTTFPPFNPGQFFGILGQRLLIWPVLGDRLALKLPPLALGLAGCVPVLVLLGWALRPHPQRPLRAPVVAAFLLLLAAAIYRSRPDTWGYDNLVVHDRYFYLPRVLLLWLVAWEFDAAPKVVAWLARGTFAGIALVHVNGYMQPAPPNYHWERHCEPIRQGVPANIPTLPEGWTLEYRGRPR